MRRLTIAISLLAATVASCGGGGDGGNYGPWRVYSSPGTTGVTALWAFAPDDVWAGSNMLLHFDGTAFTPVTTPTPIGPVADFWGFAPDDLYAVAGADLLHWDGAAWTVIDFAGAVDATDLTAIWGSSGEDLWLGDSLNGRVFHWNGTGWSTGVTQTVSVEDLWGVAGGPVFAGGTFGLSQWTGSAWVDATDSVVNEATGLWGFGASDVWAASDFGTLAHWDGAGWSDTAPPDDQNFENDHNVVWGAAPSDVWAVGDGGTISHWNGTTWSQSLVGRFPYYPFLSEVHGSSATDVWAAGRSSDGSNSSVILHYAP